MRFSIKRRYVIQGAIALGLAPTIAASCGDLTNPSSHASQGCTTSKDSGFPVSGSFVINKPATCPMKIGGAKSVAYAAVGTVPQGSVNQYQYQLSVTNRTGATYGAFYEQGWSVGGGNWVVTVTGSYTAASGGFDQNDNGYDIANNQLYVNGQWVAMHSTMAYTFGPSGLDVVAPSTGIGSGVSYNVNVSTNDPDFVGPVSWSWYVDGVLRSTSQELQWQGGAQGSQQSIMVQGVDANGLSHTGYTQVNMCSGSEIIC